MVSRMWRVFYLDYLYHDIPLVEENSNHLHDFPRQKFGLTVGRLKSVSITPRTGRISSFGSTINSVSRSWQPRTTDLFICVFTGFRYYHFDTEELFLFMMAKCKLGYAYMALCKLIFGGHASWWSFGYPWILRYLDERYNRTILHEKLRD